MSSGILEIISRQSSPDAIHSEVSEGACLCVPLCFGVCGYESMRGVPLDVLHLHFGLLSFQIAFITLDGLLDAQQEGRVPLVQAGDGVELLNLQMGGRICLFPAL